MGIWDYVNSTTDQLKRNSPDLTAVNRACRTTYDYSCSSVAKIDNAIRVNAVQKLKNTSNYLPDDGARSEIYRFANSFAKNAAIFTFHEGLKSVPAFNLEEVGVPEPAAENSCKLIITTRSLDVCRRMNCKSIKMELLSEEEAWDLFLDKVGGDAILTPDLEVIAKDVAKECARLPLAIITIGRSMNKVVDQSEWRNVLRELSMSRKGFNEMEKVIESVKISYARLKDEKLQRCLLYCALYPEDYSIDRDDVIRYLIADEIVEGNASWQAKCDEGNTILNNLESACLLESFTNWRDKKVVKMHDVIRDMALQIMGPGSMVKAREGLRDFQVIYLFNLFVNMIISHMCLCSIFTIIGVNPFSF